MGREKCKVEERRQRRRKRSLSKLNKGETDRDKRASKIIPITKIPINQVKTLCTENAGLNVKVKTDGF